MNPLYAGQRLTETAPEADVGRIPASLTFVALLFFGIVILSQCIS
jgi:hypothetical protein